LQWLLGLSRKQRLCGFLAALRLPADAYEPQKPYEAYVCQRADVPQTHHGRGGLRACSERITDSANLPPDVSRVQVPAIDDRRIQPFNSRIFRPQAPANVDRVLKTAIRVCVQSLSAIADPRASGENLFRLKR
jgi:hypothetical protein